MEKALQLVRTSCKDVERHLTTQKRDLMDQYGQFQKHNVELMKENRQLH